MDKTYRLTLPTKSLVRTIVATTINQVDSSPHIADVYDGTNGGQIVDILLEATKREKLFIEMALKDYIIRIERIPSSKERLIADTIIKGWM